MVRRLLAPLNQRKIAEKPPIPSPEQFAYSWCLNIEHDLQLPNAHDGVLTQSVEHDLASMRDYARRKYLTWRLPDGYRRPDYDTWRIKTVGPEADQYADAVVEAARPKLIEIYQEHDPVWAVKRAQQREDVLAPLAPGNQLPPASQPPTNQLPVEQINEPPPASVEWPGLPPGLIFDPKAPTPPGQKGKPKQKVPGALLQELPDGTRVPVDPHEHHLDPERPYEPNLAGSIPGTNNALRYDLWRERFRALLSPEEKTQVDSILVEMSAEQSARSRYRELEKRVVARNLDNRPLSELNKVDRATFEEWQQLRDRFGPMPRSTGGKPPPPTELRPQTIPTQIHSGFANQDDQQRGLQNILAILRSARPDEIKYWRKWYDIANEDIKQLAIRYEVPVPVVAAIVAALSPNAAWESNIYAAQRVLEGHGKKQLDFEDRADAAGATNMLTRVYPELLGKPDKLGVFTYSDNIRKAQRVLDTWRANKDKRWNPDLGKRVGIEWDPKSKRDVARAQREYDSYIARAFVPWVTKSLNAWTPFARVDTFNPNAGRLVMIPPLGDPDVGAKKVNNFYQNILYPGKNAHNPVVDGHAANIFYGDPKRKLDDVGLSDAEYDSIKAMYIEAAKLAEPILREKGIKRPLTPQEIQAVTWSVWRKAIKEKKKGPGQKQPGRGLAAPVEGLPVVAQVGLRDGHVSTTINGEQAHNHKVIEDILRQAWNLREQVRRGSAGMVEQIRDDLGTRAKRSG